jgi:hypothetical protein
MKLLRPILHSALLVLGFLAFSVASSAGVAMVLVARACKSVYPTAETGNCWSHALPNWWKHGGYLALRAADGQKFLGVFPVMHVIWVKVLPRRTNLEQYVPIKRQTSDILPWYTIVYKGVVRKVEAPHNARLES